MTLMTLGDLEFAWVKILHIQVKSCGETLSLNILFTKQLGIQEIKQILISIHLMKSTQILFLIKDLVLKHRFNNYAYFLPQYNHLK